jgi:glutamine amidotransferase
MRTIVVCDLGLGNLRSVVRALALSGDAVTVEHDPTKLASASAIVVPGQGAFRDAARALTSGFGEAISAHIKAGRPYLGICLGLQLLFESSEEAPGEKGLAHFSGAVCRIAAPGLKVPHMGWNDVTAAREGIFGSGEQLYFAHSFAAIPADSSVVAATTEYGGSVVAGVAKDNVTACQFHPEKSQRAGARFLAAWWEMEKAR